MPECFSRPICRFAMFLNDDADDAERQYLLPFVTRLACADTTEIEKQRATYINQNARNCYRTVFPLGRIALRFDKGLEVLEGVLAIGRQAEPLGPHKVQTRMDVARAGQGKLTKPATPTSVPDKPFFSKAKSWLALETEPAA